MNELYKDNKCRVFSLSPLDIQNGLVEKLSLIKLTPEEIVAHLNPVKTTEQLQSEAQQLRDELTESNIELGETSAIYQIDVHARDNINIANIKANAIGLTGESTRMWRLADNSWRETSLDELNGLVLSYIDRKELIWDAFGLWDSGDKSEPFTFEI